MLTLDRKFEVIVVFPVTDQEPAYSKPVVRDLLNALGSITLGASVIEGLGYWQPTEEVERAIHVYTFYDGSPETLVSLREAVLQVVAPWALLTGQEAVALEVNGTLEVWDTWELVGAVE